MCSGAALLGWILTGMDELTLPSKAVHGGLYLFHLDLGCTLFFENRIPIFIMRIFFMMIISKIKNKDC